MKTRDSQTIGHKTAQSYTLIKLLQLIFVLILEVQPRNLATDTCLTCLSGILHFKCDGTHAETRFRLSVKWTSPFKSAGASVQSITGSQGVRISGSNAGYTMFRGSVKGTGYPCHSPVSPSLSLPCVTVCHHVSTGLYLLLTAIITFI